MFASNRPVKGATIKVVPSKFIRVSYYSSWILETTCALTSDDGVFQCPKLVCPAEERVLGYPQAKVPNATNKIKTFNGFKPREVVQSPPAGSLINSSTKVLVTAVDQSDQAESCEWLVTLPMMETMGDMYEYITGGTYERDVRLWDEEYGWYTSSGSRPGWIGTLTATAQYR